MGHPVYISVSIFLAVIILFSALDNLRDHLENPEKLSEMKYLLLEQKYLELLSQKNRMEALKV